MSAQRQISANDLYKLKLCLAGHGKGSLGGTAVSRRLRQRKFAKVVGLNPQRPVRLGVVILVSDMRRQLDDLSFREEPPQLREEFVWNVHRRRTHPVRVFQGDSLALRQASRFLDAECRLDRLVRQPGFAAGVGVDVDSEGTPVAGRYSDSDQLNQASADGPPSGTEDQVGEEPRE